MPTGTPHGRCRLVRQLLEARDDRAGATGGDSENADNWSGRAIDDSCTAYLHIGAR